MKTGQIIKILRTDFGMTQDCLAEKLYVSRQLVSAWENGTRRPDYRTVCEIAGIFGEDTDYIIDGAKSALNEISLFNPL